MSEEVIPTFREVWYKFPPHPGQKDEDLDWIWLQWYSDGRSEMVLNERPSVNDIKNRKGCPLPDDKR